MKNIQIMAGSPRKKGNTNTIINAMTSGFDNTKTTYEISHLYDYEIKPCIDCRGCKKKSLECVLKDDMGKIYSKLDDSDIMIFGTPIYWFAPSAVTKLMLDRFRPYYLNKKLAGKKAALLMAAGEGETDSDLTIEIFKRIFESLDIEFIGSVTSQSYDIGEAEKDIKALEEIKELAKKLEG